MPAPYNGKAVPKALPIAGGHIVEFPVSVWIPGILYVLRVPVDQPFYFAQHGLPWYRVQKLDRLRAGTIFARITDPDLYAATSGICYHISPYGILDKLASQQHVFSGYRDPEAGEIPVLTNHREAVWEMILTYFAYTALTENAKVAARRRIMKLVEALGAPRNPEKLAAQLHLIFASREKDALGRVLPQVFQASMAGSRDRTGLRVAEIQHIERRFGIREIAIAQELERIDEILSRAWKTVQQVITKWGLKPHDNTGEQETLLAQDIADLELTRSEFESVLVGPYPAPLSRCASEIKTAITIRGQGDAANARVLLKMAARSVQFRFAQRALHMQVRLPLSILTHRHALPRREHLANILEALTSTRRNGDRQLTGVLPRITARLDDAGFDQPTLAQAVPLLERSAELLTTIVKATPRGREINPDDRKVLTRVNELVRDATRKI